MRRIYPILFTLTSLWAQEGSEPSHGLNLPTASSLDKGDLALRFTHRFTEQASSGSKELYGLDSFAYSGIGLDASFSSLPGLTFQAYRTADARTYTFALQQRLVARETVDWALRVERFDEVIQEGTAFGISTGILGAAVQAPVDLKMGSFTLRAVPTWLSRTRTQRDGLISLGFGAQWDITPEHGLLAELYPKPSKLGQGYRTGWAGGYQWRTRGHRFMLLATNVQGTTAHQVSSGDYFAGPRPGGDWALGFNLTRIF